MGLRLGTLTVVAAGVLDHRGGYGIRRVTVRDGDGREWTGTGMSATAALHVAQARARDSAGGS